LPDLWGLVDVSALEHCLFGNEKGALPPEGSALSPGVCFQLSSQKGDNLAADLFEYMDARGRKVFTEWRQGLQRAQQAQLDNKLNLLKVGGLDLSPKLVAGTRFGHIKKLKVKSNVQLRPRLCPGPINYAVEFTLLIGAVEKDFKTDPADADQLASDRRDEIISNQDRRSSYA
jgi:hypothetical protein